MPEDRTLYSRNPWLRVLTFVSFILIVNLSAGYIAIKFDYTSLWGGDLAFSEYALPVPLTWASAHWPSMLLFSIPLLLPSIQGKKSIKLYRNLSLAVFALTLLELDAKIPFLLFPRIDGLTAFVFSLIIAPPNRRDNPLLTVIILVLLAAATLITLYYGFSAWQHRTPKISMTRFAEGVFTLSNITVNSDYRHEMLFTVELKEKLPEEQACSRAQIMASELLREYPFDEAYQKTVFVVLSPHGADQTFIPYPLGEVSLNNQDKDAAGMFACYLKYRRK